MFRASSVPIIRSYQLYTWQFVCFMQGMWPLPRRVRLEHPEESGWNTLTLLGSGWFNSTVCLDVSDNTATSCRRLQAVAQSLNWLRYVGDNRVDKKSVINQS